MIIGFTGKAGSGKDTAADYLVSKYGFEKVSFAAILKKMLAAAGMPEPSNRDDKEKLIDGLGFTWRHAAQTLGTEWGRQCLGEDVWVNLTMKSLDPNKNYVFSDVRFDNEAEAILWQEDTHTKGYVVKLNGRGVDLGGSSGHASESDIDAFLISHTYNNNMPTVYLYEYLDKLMRDLIGDE